MTVDDAQLAVALRPAGDHWQWNSFVICEVDNRQVLAFSEFPEDGTGYLRVFNAADSALLKVAAGKEFLVRPNTTSKAHWTAQVRVGNYFLNQFDASVSCRFERAKSHDAAFTRIVYKGISLRGYTHRASLAVSDTERHFAGYSFIEAFGRTFILSSISESEDPERQFLGVTFEGAFLSQPELDALEMIIYILAGVGGVRQAVEYFDADGRWHGRQFPRLAHATGRDPHPILPPEDLLSIEICEPISRMCEKAKELFQKGIPLRAILFHVFSAQQRIPELSITHLAIALDGIKTAVVEKIKGEGNLIKHQSDFDRRMKPVAEAAAQVFSSPEESSMLEHVLNRIRNSNNWSENKRWERFWRDYIGYALSDDELKVLKHRGSAIHSAYILLTEYDLAINKGEGIDRRPYEARLLELCSDALIYRNVVNRVILRLLGYSGNAVDFLNPSERIVI